MRSDLPNVPELELLAQALEFSGPGMRISARVEAYSAKAAGHERQLFRRLEAALLAELDLSSSVSPPDASSAFSTSGGKSVSPHGSAFGSLESRANRNTFALLIATLNLAYPDHDFSSLRPDEFVREPGAATVLGSLSSALSHLRAQQISSPAYNLGLGGKASIFRSFASYPSSPPKVSIALPATQGSPEAEIVMSPPDRSGGVNNAALHPFFRQVLDPIIDLNECEVYSYQPEADSDPHADEDGSSVGDFEQDDLEGYLDDGDWSNAGRDDDDLSSSGHWHMDGLPYAPPTPRRRMSSSRRSSYGPLKRNLSTLSIQDGETSPRSPHGGLLWSSNWFFYHRASKRILFVTIWARTKPGLATFAAPTPKSAACTPASTTAPVNQSSAPYVFRPPTPGPLKKSALVNTTQPIHSPVRKRARV